MEVPSSASLPKSARLLKRSEFLFVQGQSARVAHAGLVVLARARPSAGHARLGCSVGKSFGHSPKRNRVKRLIREVFREERATLPAADFVVIAQSRLSDDTLASRQAFASMLIPMLRRCGAKALMSTDATRAP